MKQLVLVFIGGGAGSALRFLISRFLNPSTGIPYGTLSVNLLGSLLIGFLFGLSLKQNLLSTNSMLLLATGFCGGFTTFSAFTYENQVLIKNGEFFNFLLYGMGSVFLGIGAVYLGVLLSKLF